MEVVSNLFDFRRCSEFSRRRLELIVRGLYFDQCLGLVQVRRQLLQQVLRGVEELHLGQAADGSGQRLELVVPEVHVLELGQPAHAARQLLVPVVAHVDTPGVPL